MSYLDFDIKRGMNWYGFNRIIISVNTFYVVKLILTEPRESKRDKKFNSKFSSAQWEFEINRPLSNSPGKVLVKNNPVMIKAY